MPFLSSEEAGSVQAAGGLAACWRTHGGCGAVHSFKFLHGNPLLAALLSGWKRPLLLGVSPPGTPNGGMWLLVLGQMRTLSLEPLFVQPGLLQSSCNEPNPSRQSHLNAIIKKYRAFRLRESCCGH